MQEEYEEEEEGESVGLKTDNEEEEEIFDKNLEIPDISASQ